MRYSVILASCVAGLDDLNRDPPAFEHPPYLVQKILDQTSSVLEGIRPARIVLAPVPVVDGHLAPIESRPGRRYPVCIVEADQPLAIRRMQGECVAQSVRSPGGPPNAPDLKSHEIVLGVPVYATVEGEKKFEGVFRRV